MESVYKTKEHYKRARKWKNEACYFVQLYMVNNFYKCDGNMCFPETSRLSCAKYSGESR